MTTNSKLTSQRLLFLNRSYWPDVEATGQLLTALCEALVSEFDVSVLTGQPNSVVGETDELEWNRINEHNGVKILRVSHIKLPKTSIAFQAVNYLSFIRAANSALRSITPPDVVVFETDPFLTAFSACKLKERTGCRMIGYLQDIYPDVAVALGIVRNNWAIRKLRQSLFDVYQRCDRMIVLTQEMANVLIEGGVMPHRISIIPNWADTITVTPVHRNNLFRQRFALHDRFIVMYSGSLALTQPLEELIHAAKIVAYRPEILFVIIGRGPKEQSLRDAVRRDGLSNVRFFDYQPQNELAHSLSAADLHFVPIRPELTRFLMPSKLYGILAAGRPFLTNAPPGSELHAIAEIEQVGITIKNGSPQELADRILWAVENPEILKGISERARSLAVERFSKDCAVNSFRRILYSVLKTTKE